MSHRKSLFILAALTLTILLASGCSTVQGLFATPTPTATNTPMPTSTPTPTVTPTLTPTPTNTPIPTASPSATPVCNADRVIANLKAHMPYEEFEITYQDLTFVGINSLIVWFVDPEIDPSASGKEINKNAALALRHAAILSHQFGISDKCIGALFDDGINPVVVDRNYNGWFAGLIATSSLPSTPSLTDAELKMVEDAFRIQYLRQNPAKPLGSAPKGSCTWAEVRNRILRHFPTDQENVSFYLVLDESGTDVYAQWIVPANLTGELAIGFNVASMLNTLLELPCLYPPADRLIVTAVDSTGKAELFGSLPREGIRNQDVNQFELIYLKPSATPDMEPVVVAANCASFNNLSPSYVESGRKVQLMWGWRAKTKDYLQEYLDNVSFTLIVNDQTMDLSELKQETYEDGQYYFADWYAPSMALPQGEHSVVLVQILRNDVRDGFDHDNDGVLTVYKAGRFEYPPCKIIVR